MRGLLTCWEALWTNVNLIGVVGDERESRKAKESAVEVRDRILRWTDELAGKKQRIRAAAGRNEQE